MRAENTHGMSVPSPVSSVVKTLGTENGVIPQSELAAARVVLSGKVKSKPIFVFEEKKLLLTPNRNGTVRICAFLRSARLFEGEENPSHSHLVDFQFNRRIVVHQTKVTRHPAVRVFSAVVLDLRFA